MKEKYRVGDLLQDRELEDHFLLVVGWICDPAWPDITGRVQVIYLHTGVMTDRTMETLDHYYRLIARIEP